jgi:fucose permease
MSFSLTLSLWNGGIYTADSEKPKRLMDYRTPLGETLGQPRVWLSLFLFFLYTGSEVTLGTWAYTLLTESRGVQPEAAGLLVGSYWAMFTVGRVIAGLYAKRIGVKKLVISGLVVALIGACLLWWNPASVTNLVAVAVIGFAIAPIFPGLVSGTSQRVGPRFAANTIGMQMSAAALGAALVPSLVGVLAEHSSLEIIPVCLTTLFAVLIGFYWLSEVNTPMQVDFI